MSTDTPARVAREMARLNVARELAKSRVNAGIDQQDVADACGVNRSVPARWESKHSDKTISVADACLLPREMGVAMARHLAAQHGQSIVAAEHDETIHVGTLCAVMRELHEATEALAAGIADGSLETAELERIEREANDGVAELMRLANTARRLRAQQGPVRVAFERKAAP